MMIPYDAFQNRLASVLGGIASACQAAGRPSGSVRLLPVTKNHPIDAARYALRSGLLAVGENRVQEALGKIAEADFAVRWELIGPLQSNKARKAADSFGRIQTLDREKTAAALQKHCAELGKRLPVLMQVNAGDDPAKSGVSLAEAPRLLEAILAQSNLQLEGLMTIAPLDDDPVVARRCFAALRECRDDLERRGGIALPELSMGMSGDLKEAILEGSTLVRVGTALYGERDYGV